MTDKDMRQPANSQRNRLAGPLFFLGLTVFFSLLVFVIVAPHQDLKRYNTRWSPAVAAACFGQIGVIDFSAVAPERAQRAEEKLVAFLNDQHDSPYSCADIPEGTTLLSFQEGTNDGIRVFFKNQAGLHFVTGYLFRVFGFDWAILGALASLFAGLAASALYYVARFFTSAPVAMGLAVFAMANSVNLNLISIVRDYAKTSFILFAFILLFQIVVNRDWSVRRFYAACVGLGFLLGIGLCFRWDLLATFALSSAVLFFFPYRGSREPRHFWSREVSRVLAVLAVAIPFLAFYVPLDTAFSAAYDAIGHVLNLGLSDVALADARWGLNDVTFNPLYRDVSSYGHVAAYGWATGLDATYISQGYDVASMRMFAETFATFPFDLLGRCISILIDISSAEIVYPLHRGQSVFTTTMLAVSGFFYIYSYKWHRRLFFFALFYFLGSACIVSMQYIPRHYFFLHMLWFVFVIGCSVKFISECVTLPAWASRMPHSTNVSTDLQSRRVIQNSFFAVSALMLLTAFLVQKYAAQDWKKNVAAQRTIPAEFSITEEKNIVGTSAPASTDQAYVISRDQDWVDFAGQSRAGIDYEETPLEQPIGGYLTVSFKSGEECGQSDVRFWVIYTAETWAWNLTHPVNVSLNKTASTRQFLPVFFTSRSQFNRLTLNGPASECLETISWVENFPAIRLPLTFAATD